MMLIQRFAVAYALAVTGAFHVVVKRGYFDFTDDACGMSVSASQALASMS